MKPGFTISKIENGMLFQPCQGNDHGVSKNGCASFSGMFRDGEELKGCMLLLNS